MLQHTVLWIIHFPSRNSIVICELPEFVAVRGDRLPKGHMYVQYQYYSTCIQFLCFIFVYSTWSNNEQLCSYWVGKHLFLRLSMENKCFKKIKHTMQTRLKNSGILEYVYCRDWNPRRILAWQTFSCSEHRNKIPRVLPRIIIVRNTARESKINSFSLCNGMSKHR